MENSSPGIQRLSNELLRDVLDQIEADPEKLVNLDRRAYLSQESFKPPAHPSPDQAQNIASFRLTCRRFSELGAVHQFARITTRFSRNGFRRLDWISRQPELAKHVKKFSYMVPCFYAGGRERSRARLSYLRDDLQQVDVRRFIRKLDEQEDIIQSEEDESILKSALAGFTSLQHVQILRVQDAEDSILLGYLRHNQHQAQPVDFRWAPACSHSTKTLAKALLASRSPCERFSFPMLSAQSAQLLAARPPNTLNMLVQRLTSLELHFDDGTDIDRRISDLSGLFRIIFTLSSNMQAVHVGFPSHRPLSLPLEAVFHEIRWERLIAFGIQAWKLSAEEIVRLVRRHRDRLRGLRLRDVLLKEGGGMWRDVLQVLRNEFQLEWVSLRRIGYVKHFEELSADSGIEIEDLPTGGSESDEESEEISDLMSQPGGGGSTPDYDDDGRSETDLTDVSADFEHGDGGVGMNDDGENGPRAHELGFPSGLLLESSGGVGMSPWCTCHGRGPIAASVEELGDNGVFVSNNQRKAWEKWCTRRCPQHVRVRAMGFF